VEAGKGVSTWSYYPRTYGHMTSVALRLALMTCLLMHPQTKCRSSSKGPLARFPNPWRINLEGKVGPFQPQLPKCFVFADAPLGRRGIQALQTSDLAGLAIMGCLTSPSQGVSEHHFGPLGPDAPRSRPFSRLSPLPKGFLNTTKISRTHHVPTYRNIVLFCFTSFIWP
jgi:hypothetical protein